MLLYLYTVRIVALAMTASCSSRHVATAITGVLVTLNAMGSGFAVQLQTMNWWTSWIRWCSPLRWTLHSLQQLDFANLTQSIECSRNPLTRQEAPGLVLKIPCGVSNGVQALNYWAHFVDRLPVPMMPILVVVAVWAFFALLRSIVLLCFPPAGRKLSRHKRTKY